MSSPAVRDGGVGDCGGGVVGIWVWVGGMGGVRAGGAGRVAGWLVFWITSVVCGVYGVVAALDEQAANMNAPTTTRIIKVVIVRVFFIGRPPFEIADARAAAQ